MEKVAFGVQKLLISQKCGKIALRLPIESLIYALSIGAKANDIG